MKLLVLFLLLLSGCAVEKRSPAPVSTKPSERNKPANEACWKFCKCGCRINNSNRKETCGCVGMREKKTCDCEGCK